LRVIKAAGQEGRLVGGCVRDALLGHKIADIDIAIDAVPEETIDIFNSAGIKVVPTGLKHGTVTVVQGGTPFEITSLRQDVATDGRHAVVSFTKDWKADAARRDFTINALYADDRGYIYDYFGGQSDLVQGIVRFIGDPHTRIREDHLRILRYFRFALRFSRTNENGSLELDAPSLQAVNERVALLDSLSKERVQSELLKILEDPYPLKILRFMPDVFYILFKVAPDFELLGNILSRPDSLATRRSQCASLRNLFAIYPRNVGVIKHNLKLSREQCGFISALHQIQDVAYSPANLLAIRIKHGDDIARGWADVRTAIGDALPLNAFDSAAPQFPLLGRDLISAGLESPGPNIKKLLQACEDWWCESDGSPTREDCLEWCTTHRHIGLPTDSPGGFL
jgi:hypothetical protein